MTSPLHRLFHRYVLPLLSAGLLLPAGQAQEAPLPADPNEIAAGLKVMSPAMMLSPDGRWLAYSTSLGQGYLELATGKLSNVQTGWLLNGAPSFSSWSPKSTAVSLAVWREARMALSLWPASEQPLGKIAHDLIVYPRKLYPRLPAVWSPDEQTIYFFINQDLPWPKLPASEDNPPTSNRNVTLDLSGRYRRGGRMSASLQEYPGAYGEKVRSIIIALDVKSGKYGVLAKGNDIDRLSVSPDGRYLLAAQLKTKMADAQGEQQMMADYYLLPLAGLKVEDLPTIDLEKMEDRKIGWFDHTRQRLYPIVENVSTNSIGYGGTQGIPLETWSPDSSCFIYAPVGRRAVGDVYAYAVATKEIRNLTENVSVPPNVKGTEFANNMTFGTRSRKFGNLFNPLWLPGGKAVVAMGKGDVWLVPADGAAPRNLTGKFPDESLCVLAAPDLVTAAVDPAGRLTIIAKNRVSRKDTVWKLDLATGELVRVADTGLWINVEHLATDQKAEFLVYAAQDRGSAMNFYRLKLEPGAGKPEYLTKLQLHLSERAYPESRILSWENADGYKAFGLLYLPAGASATAKVPMIFKGNLGDYVSEMDVREIVGPRFYDESLHGLLNEGFAVLAADVPMSDIGVYERPLRQMVGGVNAALDAALATGVIDETRLGIVGDGQAGTMVHAVISQTNRFKVAATIAGITNIFADYMAGANGRAGDYEGGQGRMGVPLWKDPVRYMQNSPISYWDKVETPLLVIQGGYTSNPAGLAAEGFRGLARQGKDSIFAQYYRMGQQATPEALIRVRGWFREHLLGAPAVTQGAEQGSFFFGGSGEESGSGDRASVPAVSAPAPTAVPAAAANR